MNFIFSDHRRAYGAYIIDRGWPSQDRFFTPEDEKRSHGTQHYPAQSNVDIQLGHVLRRTATEHGRRRRRRWIVDVAEIAAGQADVREKHFARGENFAQVSIMVNLKIIKCIIDSK